MRKRRAAPKFSHPPRGLTRRGRFGGSLKSQNHVKARRVHNTVAKVFVGALEDGAYGLHKP
jgi:hypothetical protein